MFCFVNDGIHPHPTQLSKIASLRMGHSPHNLVKRYNSGKEPDVIIRNTIPSDCKVNLDYTQVTENGVNSVSLVVNSDEEDMYDAIKAEAHFLYPNDTRDETVSVFRETKDQSNFKVESYREDVAERIKIKISHYRDSRS